MSLFPWLVLLLAMALIAELIIVGPRAIRALLRGEGLRVTPASTRALLVLVAIQAALLGAWALLFAERQVN